MNLDAKQFDLVNARACVTAAAAAYASGPGSFMVDPVLDTHCLLMDGGDHLIISFKGSKSLRNWITDGEFLRKPFVEWSGHGTAEVHDGFLAAMEGIIPQIVAALRNAMIPVGGGTPNSNMPVVVTGHSLGGALAILTAFELSRQGFKVAQVYTFGQPRVGNGVFKALYEGTSGLKERTFRVVYREDCVARIPHLPKLHDPYRHVATEVLIDSFGRLEVNPSTLSLLASDAYGVWKSYQVSKVEVILDPLQDHHIENYVSALDGSEVYYGGVK